MGEQNDSGYEFAEMESLFEQMEEPQQDFQHHLKDSTPLKCDVHKSQDVEFFCKVHDQVVCEICRNIFHRTCSPIGKIADVSVGILSSTEYLELENNLKTLEQENMKNVDIVADRKAEMNAVYKNAIKEVEKVFKRLYECDSENLDAISSTSESIENEIRQLREGLRSTDEIKVFLTMKKANREIGKFQESLEMARQDARVSHYGFVPKESNVKPSKVLGKLSTFPIELRKVSIETQSDRHHCSVSGLVLLDNGRLVVADNGNKKIKLFSVKTMTLTFELPLDTTPLALTKITDEVVIMSSATEKKAFLFSIRDKIKLIRQFELKGMCQNIGCNETKLAASFSDLLVTQFLDQYGHVMKTVTTPTKSEVEAPKNCPKTVFFSLDPCKSDKLYQAKCAENKVIQINNDGKVIFQFEASNMKYPVGFASGADGSIYVCCRDSDNIFKLSHDLSVGHVILNEEDGLISPWCIALCNDENLLYVGGYGCKDIQVFKI